MSYAPRPAELVLAAMLDIKHSPRCRQINADYNEKQPSKWFHSYVCHCDFYDRLQQAVVRQVREDQERGIIRSLDED